MAFSEIEQSIIELWEDGQSATHIGRELGITRNAVLGRIYRMRREKGVKLGSRRGVTCEIQPKVQNFNQRATRVKAAMQIRKQRLQIQRQEEIEIPFLDRKSDQCAFIAGDYAQYQERNCCGADVVMGSSYCAWHHSLCYRKASDTSNMAEASKYNMRKVLRPTVTVLATDFERADAV